MMENVFRVFLMMAYITNLIFIYLISPRGPLLEPSPSRSVAWASRNNEHLYPLNVELPYDQEIAACIGEIYDPDVHTVLFRSQGGRLVTYFHSNSLTNIKVDENLLPLSFSVEEKDYMLYIFPTNVQTVVDVEDESMMSVVYRRFPLRPFHLYRTQIAGHHPFIMERRSTVENMECFQGNHMVARLCVRTEQCYNSHLSSLQSLVNFRVPYHLAENLQIMFHQENRSLRISLYGEDSKCSMQQQLGSFTLSGYSYIDKPDVHEFLELDPIRKHSILDRWFQKAIGSMRVTKRFLDDYLDLYSQAIDDIIHMGDYNLEENENDNERSRSEVQPVEENQSVPVSDVSNEEETQRKPTSSELASALQSGSKKMPIIDEQETDDSHSKRPLVENSQSSFSMPNAKRLKEA